MACLGLAALLSACGGASDSSQAPSVPPGASTLDTASADPSDSATPDASAPNATTTAATTAIPSPPPAPIPSPLVGPDYRIDDTVDWFHFTAVKCGTPAGRWDLAVDGVRNLGGGRLVLTGAGTVDLDGATSTGPWQANYAIELVGVPSARGGQDGAVTGVAILDGDVLSITGQTGQGSFFSQTPAAAFWGPAGNPTRDFQLHVQVGDFC
jgi:hypothetical protein